MERFALNFQDDVFFDRFDELSAEQIRFYLDTRRMMRDWARDGHPTVRVNRKDSNWSDEDELRLLVNLGSLCEKGFILRETFGS